jgi:hypothetical protein
MSNNRKRRPADYAIIFFTSISVIFGVMAYMNHVDAKSRLETVKQQSERIRRLEKDLQECRRLQQNRRLPD